MQAAHDSIHIDFKAVPMIADYVMPILTGLAYDYPTLTMSYTAGMDYVEMKPGAKVLFLRGGPLPNAPDTASWSLGFLHFRLYGSPGYIERMGLPKDATDLQRFGFVTHNQFINRAPWERWLLRTHPKLMPVLRSDSEIVHRQAVAFGHCLGFLPISALLLYTSLIEVFPDQPEWNSEVSLVTHIEALKDPLFSQITETLVQRLRAAWT